MKLFRVKLRTFGKYAQHYVVAEDATAAHRMVKEWCRERKLLFDAEREMDSIDLLADTATYNDCGTMLHIPPLE
jgi:hypothetical protein